MHYLRGLIISDNQTLTAELDGFLSQITSSLYVRKIGFPDDSTTLETMVRSFAPSIVFLDMTSPALALRAGMIIQSKSTTTHLVGISGETTRESLIAAVQTGMRDVLHCPLTLEDVHRCLRQAFTIVEEKLQAAQRRQQVFSFLPAKVGSGTSTIALHTAHAMARFGSARVALMDLDFDCGVIDFMLKLPYGTGLSQIADLGVRMDETLWSRLVSKYGDLDILRSGFLQSHRRVTAQDMDHILGFARANYDVMCVDLPGAAFEMSESVLEHSDLVFVVCTPELSSVHLVRRRLETLRDMKLGDRVRIIYNRCDPKAKLNKTDVEDVLGAPVFAMIGNDYETLQKALMNGRPVDSDTALGRSYSDLVHKIIGVNPTAPIASAHASATAPSGLWSLLSRLFPNHVRARQPLPPPQFVTASASAARELELV